MSNTNQVAAMILAQLGGNKFRAMTGASNLLDLGNGLQLKVGRNEAKVTHVRVILEPSDTYRVTFLRVRSRGLQVETLHEAGMVYADNLRAIFEEHTGLRTSL